MLNKDIDGVDVLAVLLVDLEGLIVHADLDTLLSDVFGGVLLQLLDVTGNSSTVRLACSKHKQVLQRWVVAESCRLEQNLLE